MNKKSRKRQFDILIRRINHAYNYNDKEGNRIKLIPKIDIDSGKVKILFNYQGIKIYYYNVKGIENIPDGVYLAVPISQLNGIIIFDSSVQTIIEPYNSIPNFSVLIDNQGTGKYESPNANSGVSDGGDFNGNATVTRDHDIDPKTGNKIPKKNPDPELDNQKEDDKKKDNSKKYILFALGAVALIVLIKKK
jgi:hypothetical protein